jgi:hypothetical protein
MLSFISNSSASCSTAAENALFVTLQGTGHDIQFIFKENVVFDKLLAKHSAEVSPPIQRQQGWQGG